MVLALGAGVRVVLMSAYPHAFWYDGDSGSYLNRAQLPFVLSARQAVGYVVVLKAFRPTGEIVWVVVAQHLLGLATAVTVYLVLRRLGVRSWLSALATLPLLLDGRLLTIEHHILSETVCIALIVAGVATVLWRSTTGPRAGATAGLLLAAAWFVRPIVLPIAVLLLVYLLVRQPRATAWVSFGVAFAIPYAAIAVAADGRMSAYGSNSLALYGRTAAFADCARLDLPTRLRTLCATPGHRPDWYAWDRSSPGRAYLDDRSNPILRQFAVAVIRQQPNDYLATVGRETGAHFLPWIHPGAVYDCLYGRYAMPATAREPETGPLGCHPELAASDFRVEPSPRGTNPPATPLTTALAKYSRWITTPGVAFSGVVLVTTVAFVRRRRRPEVAREAVLLTGAGVVTIVAPVVVGMYDPRYDLPALPLLCLGGALAVHQLIGIRPRHLAPTSPAVTPMAPTASGS